LRRRLSYADDVATKSGNPEVQPKATLPAVRGIDLLRARYAVGQHLRTNARFDAKQIESWARATSETLQRVFGEDTAAAEFSSMEASEADESGDEDRMRIRLDTRLAMLEGLIVRAEDLYAEPIAEQAASKRVLLAPSGDETTTQAVVDFLESIQCSPIVCGRFGEPGSAIEAFDRHRDVGFAIVMLSRNTALGGTNNGLLELGFLLGKLGRGRVCVVQNEPLGAEHYDQSVLRVELDEAGKWQDGVVKALRDAGIA
jgi:hypothetical protein